MDSLTNLSDTLKSTAFKGIFPKFREILKDLHISVLCEYSPWDSLYGSPNFDCDLQHISHIILLH